MRDDGLHVKTVADRLVIVKQWFKWAVVKAKPPLLAVNPIALEEIEEGESSPQPCYTPEQVAVILANACKDHEQAIFAVMAYRKRPAKPPSLLPRSGTRFAQQIMPAADGNRPAA
jgi:hypothetical protein